jgi:4-hydroxybenzoate polyprenyltransferase
MIFQWYIRGSIHVSLCLLALVGFSSAVFDAEVPKVYYLALFFGSIAGYNTIKYGPESGKHWRLVGGERRFVIALSALSCGAGIYYLMQLPPGVWLLLFLAGIITVFYAVPLKPGGINLRSYGLLKVILVALVWTVLSVWAPLWGQEELKGWDVGVESFQRILWVFLLMLPFEIRDLKTDPPQMKSIPQRFGLRATRNMAWGIAVLFALATGMKDSLAVGEFGVKTAVAVLMGLSISFATEKQHPYYAAFWVEGIPLVALGLLLWFRN